MEFIKAKPNEYLVVATSGQIKNLGVARSTFLWPGQSHILIPSTQIEAEFAMTQETKDGIGLRFKGIIIYFIEQPEIAAQRFDFSDDKGPQEINRLIANVCLGELRDTVSKMSMDACINERKTTLTDAVSNELQKVVQSWGIKINVAQVAQVFIVEEEIRKQLESQVRNELRANSELSDIKTDEAISRENSASRLRLKKEESVDQKERRKIELERKEFDIKTEEAISRENSASQLRLKKEEFQHQKERMKIELERKELERENEKKEIELMTPFKVFEAEQDIISMKKMVELYALKEKMNVLKGKANLAIEIEQNKVRKEMLPLEQVPKIAESVSRMFNGANLSFYKDSSDLLSGVTPMLDMVTRALQPSAIVKKEE